MKKGGVETQEKICGKVCSFCPFLFIVPLKFYASEGKYYSTNDTNLQGAQLQKADLRDAQLQEANLVKAWLQEAHLSGAHLQRADLSLARLQGAHLIGAQLQKARLIRTQLQGADLLAAQFNHADLYGAQLQGTSLVGAEFEKTLLGNTRFADTDGVGPRVVDIFWGVTNLAVVDWSQIKILGDEYQAKQKRYSEERGPDRAGKIKDRKDRLMNYEGAVRANRQLAVVLRDQGLNEEADYFANRAQFLQRLVWHLKRRPLKFALSWFLYLLAGYGYRPLRSVLWYLVIIIGFALAYYTFGHLSLWPPDAFIYSLTSFHGRGFFPGLEGKHSLHDPLIMLAAFEAVVGLFIEISFIATFTQRFFGR